MTSGPTLHGERTPKWRAALGALSIAAIVSLIVWGFVKGRGEAASERAREQPVKAPPRVTVHHREHVITLDSVTQSRGGIVTARVDSASAPEEIRAFATVVELQALADLRSRYSSALADAERARASLEASRREYERLKLLYQDEQNVSAKSLEAAEATLRSAEATAQAAATPLRIMAATGRQDWGSVVGSWIVEGSPAFGRLLNSQDVLIQATLPPDISIPIVPKRGFVQVGDGPRISARVVSAAGRTDPRVQGMSYFLVAPAGSGLVPGMSVTALLPAGKVLTGSSVPESAVVWWQGSAWVYLQTGPNTFERREIPVDGGTIRYVVPGLPAGARVVTGGAQSLLSEELRADIEVGEEQTR